MFVHVIFNFQYYSNVYEDVCMSLMQTNMMPFFLFLGGTKSHITATRNKPAAQITKATFNNDKIMLTKWETWISTLKIPSSIPSIISFSGSRIIC